jgi:ADP-ribose pyrophosphatase
VRFPDGSEGTLEIVRHPGASAVVPFLDSPDDPDPRVVIIHQYRYAAGGLIYEVPAGIPRSSEEAWEVCARRELIEETGYEASDFRYMGRILTTPGFSDEIIHLFSATGLTEVGVHRDEDEFMEVRILPLSEVMEKMRTGAIVDAKSIAALLLAASFRASFWKEDRPVPDR